jgi:hypothetical protein
MPELLDRLATTLNELEMAIEHRDGPLARSHVAELLVAINEVDVGRHPGHPSPELSGETTAAIWLMKQSLSHLEAAAAEAILDWDKIGAAFAFAESGRRQLEDSLEGGL